jgi:hypothetical protein
MPGFGAQRQFEPTHYRRVSLDDMRNFSRQNCEFPPDFSGGALAPIVCGCPPDLQGDFFGDILARRFYRSCVRPLVVACFAPRAGMQFEEQGPHRFRELG